ncbi:hypothetical protein WB334_25105, partial [Escherichia coli]|uniref:hypothetical protein n=1 Tax=Escherichia coli TaxID=562 RepID=UPI002157E302
MQQSDFIGYYKTLATADLLGILANKKDYQQSAIEAAHQELNNRNLSESELSEAKQQLIEKKLIKEKRKQKIIDAEIKIKNAVNKVADNVNPIQKEKPTSDKIIKTIAIVYGGFFLLQLFSNFKLTLAI